MSETMSTQAASASASASACDCDKVNENDSGTSILTGARDASKVDGNGNDPVTGIQVATDIDTSISNDPYSFTGENYVEPVEENEHECQQNEHTSDFNQNSTKALESSTSNVTAIDPNTTISGNIVLHSDNPQQQRISTAQQSSGMNEEEDYSSDSDGDADADGTGGKNPFFLSDVSATTDDGTMTITSVSQSFPPPVINQYSTSLLDTNKLQQKQKQRHHHHQSAKASTTKSSRVQAPHRFPPNHRFQRENEYSAASYANVGTDGYYRNQYSNVTATTAPPPPSPLVVTTSNRHQQLSSQYNDQSLCSPGNTSLSSWDSPALRNTSHRITSSSANAEGSAPPAGTKTNVVVQFPTASQSDTVSHQYNNHLQQLGLSSPSSGHVVVENHYPNTGTSSIYSTSTTSVNVDLPSSSRHLSGNHETRDLRQLQQEPGESSKSTSSPPPLVPMTDLNIRSNHSTITDQSLTITDHSTSFIPYHNTNELSNQNQWQQWHSSGDSMLFTETDVDVEGGRCGLHNYDDDDDDNDDDPPGDIGTDGVQCYEGDDYGNYYEHDHDLVLSSSLDTNANRPNLADDERSGKAKDLVRRVHGRKGRSPARISIASTTTNVAPVTELETNKTQSLVPQSSTSVKTVPQRNSSGDSQSSASVKTVPERNSSGDSLSRPPTLPQQSRSVSTVPAKALAKDEGPLEQFESSVAAPMGSNNRTGRVTEILPLDPVLDKKQSNQPRQQQQNQTNRLPNSNLSTSAMEAASAASSYWMNNYFSFNSGQGINQQLPAYNQRQYSNQNSSGGKPAVPTMKNMHPNRQQQTSTLPPPPPNQPHIYPIMHPPFFPVSSMMFQSERNTPPPHLKQFRPSSTNEMQHSYQSQYRAQQQQRHQQQIVAAAVPQSATPQLQSLQQQHLSNNDPGGYYAWLQQVSTLESSATSLESSGTNKQPGHQNVTDGDSSHSSVRNLNESHLTSMGSFASQRDEYMQREGRIKEEEKSESGYFFSDHNDSHNVSESQRMSLGSLISLRDEYLHWDKESDLKENGRNESGNDTNNESSSDYQTESDDSTSEQNDDTHIRDNRNRFRNRTSNSTSSNHSACLSPKQRSSLRERVSPKKVEVEGTFNDGIRRNDSINSYTKRENIFANLHKQSAVKVSSRQSFVPNIFTDNSEKKSYPTYICPNCKTEQRIFFSADDAGGAVQGGPGSYLAIYFALYVVMSLFIFGIEEGWKPLDCIYFAVITLTTAGLGDFVPTTDANKVVCSIFIYFGVACIGLLLGSYIAGMLDERAAAARRERTIQSCPTCAKLKLIKEKNIQPSKKVYHDDFEIHTNRFDNGFVHHNTERADESAVPAKAFARQSMLFRSERCSVTAKQVEALATRSCALYMPKDHVHHRSVSGGNKSTGLRTISTKSTDTHTTSKELDTAILSSPPGCSSSNKAFDLAATKNSPPPPKVGLPTLVELGSPVTRRILESQGHTRHYSFDIKPDTGAGNETPSTLKRSKDSSASFQRDYGTRSATALSSSPPNSLKQPVRFVDNCGHHDSNSRRKTESDYTSTDTSDDEFRRENDSGYSSDDDSHSSCSTTSTQYLTDDKKIKVQTAKFVFLTLQNALLNSLVIIACGCIGFWLIEGFSLVDSWYFTTVLLTTVGYGDIAPQTQGGKLFATVYILVGGTILLNNMSSISMIPLELRRLRIERAVLTQFGDHLDDATLRELATGPVIQRLHLSANRVDGLDECTREMFALAMLIRLGKVTEDDIRQTFASFRRLDVNNEGVLNSKSIIAGMIKKTREQQQVLKTLRQSSTISDDVATPASGKHPPPPSSSSGTSNMPNKPKANRDGKYWFGRQGSLYVNTDQGELYRFASSTTPLTVESNGNLASATSVPKNESTSLMDQNERSALLASSNQQQHYGDSKWE